MRNKDRTEFEISSLLEAVYQKYGYDFRQYSEAHIRRRITNRMTMSGLEDISQMQSKILNDKIFAANQRLKQVCWFLKKTILVLKKLLRRSM